MRYLYTLLMALILLSCSENEAEKGCREVEYDKVFEMKVSDEVCFPDGNTILLEKIEHQLCPCDVVCVWEGDLFITFSTTVDGETKEKSFFPTRFEIEPEIFQNHHIISSSYSYSGNNGEVPPCAEDFEDFSVIKKMQLSSRKGNKEREAPFEHEEI